MKTTSSKSRPLNLLAATLFVALAGTVALSAQAQPWSHDMGDMAGAEAMMGHGMGHGMHRGGGPGMARGRMMERMLDSVNASAEQRAQIRKIVEAAHTDMQAQRVTRQKLRQDGAAIFTQPTVDARAAEALRQHMLAQHDQASKRRLQMMLDISRVLTPEQRKALADRMQQRGAMMERHRAERAAVEAAKPAK